MFLRRHGLFRTFRTIYSSSPAFSTSNSCQNEAEILKQLQTTFQNEQRDHGIVPVFKKALLHHEKIAIKDNKGEVTFGRLFAAAKRLAQEISSGEAGARVCFLCPNDSLYVVANWAIWFSGQVAIPLSPRHPPDQLEYYVKDSEASLLVCSAELESLLAPVAAKLNKKLVVIDRGHIPDEWSLKEAVSGDLGRDGKFYAKSNAMLLYTSGTTGQPKGVVLTHANLNAQVESLTNAWQMDDKDTLLHVLPLHHTHGFVNGLLLPLSNGSKVVMLPQFDSSAVWTHLLNVNLPSKDRINVFMAVPTIYSFLIKEYENKVAKDSDLREFIKTHCKNHIRLMISGSAPLPETVFKRWEEISSHKLLERYGMTECGMALSNPYIQDGARERRPATVGRPLPYVEAKITEPNVPSNTLIQMKGEPDTDFWAPTSSPTPLPKSPTNVSGELFLRGRTIFSEYWNRPEETAKEFIDGWFKTGDIAAFEDGYFRILGRSSVDIIKSGGYKLSALEIESKLLQHPRIVDCAVVGLPDETYGQRVGALVVLAEGERLDAAELKEWSREKMAGYQFPSVIKFIDSMPKNAMGKVNKKELVRTAFENVSK